MKVYKCCSTSDLIYCAVGNQGRSCTETLCADPEACPKQQCILMEAAQDCPEGTGLSMGFPRWQTASPIQVVSNTRTQEYLSAGMLLLNTGEAALTEVSIGLAVQGLADNNSSSVPKTLWTSVSAKIPAYIRARSIGAVYLPQWKLNDLAAIVAGKGAFTRYRAVVGVVSARLENGHMYEYPLGAAGHFTEEPRAEVSRVFEQAFTDETLIRFIEDNPVTRERKP